MLFTLVLFFGLTFWLGLYLLHRDRHEPRLLWTGLELVSYAIGIGFVIIYINNHTELPSTQQTFFSPAYWWLLSLPALLWTGAAIRLLPESTDLSDSGRVAPLF